MTTARNQHWGKAHQQTFVWLRWLLACVVLWYSPAAYAQAPMCDETGASVLAPLPAPPASGGELSWLECRRFLDVNDRLLPGLPGEHPQAPHAVFEPAVMFGLAVVLPCGAGPSIELSFEERVFSASEHEDGVFRPPCGR